MVKIELVAGVFGIGGECDLFLASLLWVFASLERCKVSTGGSCAECMDSVGLIGLSFWLLGSLCAAGIDGDTESSPSNIMSLSSLLNGSLPSVPENRLWEWAMLDLSNTSRAVSSWPCHERVGLMGGPCRACGDVLK